MPHAVTGPFAIGRGEECQLRLNDPSVSRKHCVLVPTGVGVQVTDEGSRHGTRLNGESLTTPGLAQHGDRIAVGTDVLVVRDLERMARAELDTVRRTSEVFAATPARSPTEPTADVDPLVAAIEDVERRLATAANDPSASVSVPRALIRMLQNLVQTRARVPARLLQRAASALLDAGGADAPVDDVIRMHAARGVELARPTADALVRAVERGARFDTTLALAYLEQLSSTTRSAVLAADVTYAMEQLRTVLRRS